MFLYKQEPRTALATIRMDFRQESENQLNPRFYYLRVFLFKTDTGVYE